MLSVRDPLQIQRHIQTQSEGIENCILCKQKSKESKARVAVLLSDKTDIKIKTVTRHKKGYYIIVKGSIEEDITIIYAPNTGAPQYIQQMLTDIKGKLTIVPWWRTLAFHLNQQKHHPDRKSIKKHRL